MAVGMPEIRRTMKHEFEFKHLEPTPAVRSMIDQRIERLDRQLQALAGKDMAACRCECDCVPF
jgi:hypothetical protein